MKLYPSPKANDSIIAYFAKVAVVIALLNVVFMYAAKSQGLVFKNSYLYAGSAGENGAKYRFPNVTTNVDAIVELTGRSSDSVLLSNIDISTMGHDKAFQPQVTYGAGNVGRGPAAWWLEFKVSFVNSMSSNSITVNNFAVTALDVDGNSDKLQEMVCFFGAKNAVLELNTVLQSTKIGDMTEFLGPVQTYNDIDTGATLVMVTNNYENKNNFTMRIGGKILTSGTTGATNRYNSIWFRSFNYAAPTLLDVKLSSFSAALLNEKVALNWATSMEKNFSHFVIERSFNGYDFSDAAMLFANGNSEVTSKYAYNDKLPAGNSGIVYYRLRMVDADGRYSTSDVKMVRLGKATNDVKIITYPNPVVSELRVTLPASWQNKAVSFEVYNSNGQVVKRMNNIQASQTEVINVNELSNGLYVVKAICDTETAVQRIVKSK